MSNCSAKLADNCRPIQYRTIQQKRPNVINWHGEKFYDYYDWLKNESERKNWIFNNENHTLTKYLDQHSQNIDWKEIRRKFHNPHNCELFSDIQFLNGHIFYTYQNPSKSNNKSIFGRVKSWKDKFPHVVFDSNRIEHGSVIEHRYSPNGRYCAFTISDKIECSLQLQIVDVESGETRGNGLQLFSFEKIAWSGDSTGFFIYYDSDGDGARHLYYHFVDKHAPDILISQIPKSEANDLSFEVSGDYKYLILCNSRVISVANIERIDTNMTFKVIFSIVRDAFYEYVGNYGDFFVFLTNVGAPKNHVIEIDIRNKKRKQHFDIVVAENLNGHGILKSAIEFCGYLFLNYIDKAQSSVYLYSLSGQRIEYQINLKDELVVASKMDKYGIIFETSSFKTPRKVYRIQLNQLVGRQFGVLTCSTIDPVLWKESTLPAFDRMEISVNYDSYSSFDGTEIPITIIQKKGSNCCRKPCLVYAYGGFGNCLLPKCDLYLLLFVELFNGVVVLIHIRGDGGGAHGDGGWRPRPIEFETSVDDLIAGVEHLKKHSYSNIIDAKRIAFYGASHGSLIGAVTINRKRDLFSAVILLNGNMDLMDDSSHTKEDFECIKRYAPLLHIQRPTKPEESYPITLLVASRNDEVVCITNSLKYLAHRRATAEYNELQRDKPTLMKVLNSGGHQYSTAIKAEYVDTVFTKLKFLASAMKLRVDKNYEPHQMSKSFAEIMNGFSHESSAQYQIIERKEPRVIAMHREKIFDYYDWLKDKCHWNKILKAESAALQNYLELNSTQNNWTKIENFFQNAMDYEIYRDVQYVNGSIFYSHMDFSKSIYKPIFKKLPSLDGCERVVFDSNKMLETIVEHAYSPNGEYCAITTSVENQKSNKIMIIDVESGKALGKCLQLFNCVKIAWSGDSSGFFIYYDPDGKKKQDLYYHYVDANKPDKMIATIRKADANCASFQISRDYKYLIWRSSQMLSVANIESLDVDITFKNIFKCSPHISYEYIGNEGDTFFFLTNFGAPKHHLIKANIGDHIDMWNAKVIIPENLDGHGVLVNAYKYCRYLFLIYIENVQNALYIYSLTMHRIEYQIHLENENIISMNIDGLGFFLETQTFTAPRKVYRVDFHQLKLQPLCAFSIVQPTLWKESTIPQLNVDKFHVRHDSFRSFDQIKVPMTIIQKNDGSDACKKPCLVFAYGGHGIPIIPVFKLLFLLFIELFNGVVVFIHIRGGGELGDGWILQPTEVEISFHDLIAGVQYLKSDAYNSNIDSTKIAFYGASHGGLTGAVATNLNRNAFRSVIFLNANMDLLTDLPLKGRIWAKQYGNLSNNDDFACIKRYAPLLHIQRPTKPEESYPNTLLVASRNDEVVCITNSLKYLAHRRATAENNQFQRDKPTLLKVLKSGGHHFESAFKTEIIDAVFVQLKFLAESMDAHFDTIYQRKHFKQT